MTEEVEVEERTIWDDLEDLRKSLVIVSPKGGRLNGRGGSQVGPGWYPLLEALDHAIVSDIAKMRVIDKREVDVKVVQIKEKFGSLRVYLDFEGLSPEETDVLQAFVEMAERMSHRMCEECGAIDVETRVQNKQEGIRSYGWLKTFCKAHHAMRDAGQEPWRVRDEAERLEVRTRP